MSDNRGNAFTSDKAHFSPESGKDELIHEEHERVPGDSPPLESEMEKTAPGSAQDGDIGAKWLAQYNGEKHRLDDRDSDAVRNRVGCHRRGVECKEHVLMSDRQVPDADYLLHLLYVASMASAIPNASLSTA